MFYKSTIFRSSKEQLEGLELLRAIAALMIMLFHAHSVASHHTGADNLFFDTPSWWYSCIEMFFIMSGFLMVHMSRSLYGSAGGVKEFIWRRAIRTPPLYYIFTFLIFAIFLAVPSVADAEVSLRRLVASLLFFPLTGVPPVIMIGWTLNYEIFFYCITAASIFLRYPWGPLCSIAALLLLTATGLFIDRSHEPLTLWTDPLLLNFALGNVLAVAFYAGVSMSASARIAALFVAAALLAIPIDVTGPWRPFLFTPAIGFIVAALTFREKAFDFGPAKDAIRFVSDRTYTMYLCHILVIKASEKIIYAVLPGFPPLLFILVSATAAITATIVLYELIERPLTAYLRNWLHQRKRRTSSPLPEAGALAVPKID